jgi:hypothetical protein
MPATVTKSGTKETPAAGMIATTPEPVFLNVYGAQELIPRNKFRQPL